jgi:glycosyltransferase involved in cell wall biosynthesis
MNVLVSLEERFQRTPDQKIWSTGAASYSFWKRYLDVFDEVRVVGRVGDVAQSAASWQRADGPGVIFEAVPYYVGPLQYARKFFAVRAAIRAAVQRSDAVILRVASPIARAVQREMEPNRPFGAEVVGDPYEVFAPGAVSHPLRPILRSVMTSQLKRQCQQACAVAYVTGEELQRRYAPNSRAHSTTYSSVELRDDAFAASPRVFTERPVHRALRIVSVGTLEVPYKGFDVLIEAVSICIRDGFNVELEIIGDGRLKGELETLAAKLGVAHYIMFAGRISAGAAIRERLDSADLFALASKTEGLPRAMIEAMARGLPCVGSNVGGIPELLAANELVPRGNVAALARKISEIARDSNRLTRLSAENLGKAREYHDSILSGRRRQFFEHVREATDRWASNRKSAGVEVAARRDANRLQAERSR